MLREENNDTGGTNVSFAIIQTALDNGLIFGLVALSLFISFSILDICDLSTDGCYMLGAAVGVAVTISGHPILALPASMLAGICSGYVTALLQTRFGVPSILAGIIVNTGLYTINLMAMGMKTSLNVVGTSTIYDLFKALNGSEFWMTWSRSVLLFVLVGTSNAVNLTDGLDGLASGTVIAASLAYMMICLWLGKLELAVFCAAMVGACLGFLKYNYHPAKIFMGDTGSLALGGALAAIGILTHTEVLLAIIGIIFVCEAMSVIIQVISFKTTGKRVFLMSPIHHHFELKGWSETRVVRTFWLVGLLGGLAGLILFKIG